ncbi:MAG: sigma-70 family RNA polymerase sigma factor [Verrucomicrobia bacterium]|nr:sigma-70 family RNA polymerase sigma factor [Verrucomicrobiota bacterium]
MPSLNMCDQTAGLRDQIQAAIEMQAAETAEATLIVSAVSDILESYMSHMVCEECLGAVFEFAATQPGQSWSENDNVLTAVEFHLALPAQLKQFEMIAKIKFPQEDPAGVFNEWFELVRETGIGTLGAASESLRYACSQFDPGRGSLFSFLKQRFRFFCQTRGGHLNDGQVGPIVIELVGPQPPPDVDAELEDKRRFIEFCLNRMRNGPQDWRILALHWLKGLSHAEIAKKRGITEGNSKVRLHRAMKDFHKIAAAWLELEKIQPKLRQAVITRCLHLCTLQETAERCGCSEEVVKERERLGFLELWDRVEPSLINRKLKLKRLGHDILFAYFACDILRLSAAEAAKAEEVSEKEIQDRLTEARRLLSDDNPGGGSHPDE